MDKRLGEVSVQLIARNEVYFSAAPSRLGTQRLAVLDSPPPQHGFHELGSSHLQGRYLLISERLGWLGGLNSNLPTS